MGRPSAFWFPQTPCSTEVRGTTAAYDARVNAIIEARRRWGATGQAYTVHHGCATFCEVGHYLGARWARLGIGETWEEAFEAADVLLEDQRSEFRICSSLAMGDRDLAWQGG